MMDRAISMRSVALFAGLMVAGAGSLPAAAQDGNTWPRWPGSAYASNSDPVDRSFVKEWEATPPKGYPTLSPANIAASHSERLAHRSGDAYTTANDRAAGP